MSFANIGVGILGFSAGFIVAGGVVALMVSLGIITRFIGITRTARHISLFENAIFVGTMGGTILTTFRCSLATGAWLLGILGLFTGIFVGGWIMALAEIINVFPVYCRRLGIRKGFTGIVITLALGKTCGSLLQFWKGW